MLLSAGEVMNNSVLALVQAGACRRKGASPIAAAVRTNAVIVRQPSTKSKGAGNVLRFFYLFAFVGFFIAGMGGGSSSGCGETCGTSCGTCGSSLRTCETCGCGTSGTPSGSGGKPYGTISGTSCGCGGKPYGTISGSGTCGCESGEH